MTLDLLIAFSLVEWAKVCEGVGLHIMKVRRNEKGKETFALNMSAL